MHRTFAALAASSGLVVLLVLGVRGLSGTAAGSQEARPPAIVQLLNCPSDDLIQLVENTLVVGAGAATDGAALDEFLRSDFPWMTRSDLRRGHALSRSARWSYSDGGRVAVVIDLALSEGGWNVEAWGACDSFMRALHSGPRS